MRGAVTKDEQSAFVTVRSGENLEGAVAGKGTVEIEYLIGTVPGRATGHGYAGQSRTDPGGYIARCRSVREFQNGTVRQSNVQRGTPQTCTTRIDIPRPPARRVGATFDLRIIRVVQTAPDVGTGRAGFSPARPDHHP
jgi:hypothetical protein